MIKLLTLIAVMWLVVGCESEVTDSTDILSQRVETQERELCQIGKCSCDTPLGNIAHGSKVTSYSRDRVECNEGCGRYAQELVCENGVLHSELPGGALGPKADLSTKTFKCTVNECPSCRLGDNLILSGESIITYSTQEVGCRDSCEDVKQIRTCVLGVLSGTNTFQHTSCERKVCRCPLPDQSGYVSLDGQVDLYPSETPACGTTCAATKQTRTCEMQGSAPNEIFELSGNAANIYRSCTNPSNCTCTLPGGMGILTHTETRQIWNTATAACGETCAGKPNVIVRCDNGTLKNNANNQVINLNSATYAGYRHQCQAQACISCPLPAPMAGTNIPHGQTHTFYRNLDVGCSADCEPRVRTCQNGSFDTISGAGAFNAPQCARRVCRCPVPNNPGVTVTVGNTWNFFSLGQAACGTNCSDIDVVRTCREVASATTPTTYTYAFDGNNSTHPFGACSPPSGCSCALPGTLGQISNGTTERLTSVSQLACGQSCESSPSVLARCDNGVLVNSANSNPLDTTNPTFPFKYRCSQAPCSDCPLLGYGTIRNNDSIRLYSRSEMGCADDPDLLSFNFACVNGELQRNGIAYNPANDPSRPEQWFTTYTYNCPGCPLPWGGQIGEGMSVNAYKYSGTVLNGCGRGCKKEERLCKSGVLQGDASYDKASCDNTCDTEGGGAPPRLCLLRWQNSYVTPDAEIPVYSKKVVGCNDSCQNYFLLSRCNMTTGIFEAPSEYIYPTCKEVCP